MCLFIIKKKEILLGIRNEQWERAHGLCVVDCRRGCVRKFVELWFDLTEAYSFYNPREWISCGSKSRGLFFLARTDEFGGCRETFRDGVVFPAQGHSVSGVTARARIWERPTWGRLLGRRKCHFSVRRYPRTRVRCCRAWVAVLKHLHEILMLYRRAKKRVFGNPYPRSSSFLSNRCTSTSCLWKW